MVDGRPGGGGVTQHRARKQFVKRGTVITRWCMNLQLLLPTARRSALLTHCAKAQNACWWSGPILVVALLALPLLSVCEKRLLQLLPMLRQIATVSGSHFTA